MKRALGFGGIGVIAFGIFFILQIPAATLIQHLDRYLPGIAVAGAEGTLYRGRAEDLSVRATRVGALAWQWRPLALFSGALAYSVTARDAELDLQTQASFGILNRVLRLAPCAGQLPLARAIALAGRPPPPLNGVLHLALDEIAMGADGSFRAATGTVQLRDLHTAFGRTLRLGDFTAEVQTPAAGQGIEGTISDAGGPLMMRGNLTLAPDGGYRFSGELGVRAVDDQELKPILAGLLGAPGPDGQWRITFSGRLTI